METSVKQANHTRKLKQTRRAGFTLLELIAVMVLIGVMGAVSGVFIAPMAQSFATGRRMLRTASSSQFAFDRMNRLMSRARYHSILVGSGQIDFYMQTGEDTTQAVQLRHDSATDQLLLDGEPLLQDVADYKVAYTADGVILSRIVFNSAPDMPIDLAVYPRND